jgi:hypothetical protein
VASLLEQERLAPWDKRDPPKIDVKTAGSPVRQSADAMTKVPRQA